MLKFGLLGAARIAPPAVLQPCAASGQDQVLAIAARQIEKARRFADIHGIERVFDNYETLISLDNINVIYVGLPISLHYRWTMAALNAGKHVLCEKSLASNEDQALEMAALAKSKGLILMDAFHYRYHPLFHRAKEIYQSGVLGTIREINAEFRVPISDRADIRMNYATGGGVTPDIACYPLSWIRHISGLEPEVLSAKAIIGPVDVDLYMEAELALFDESPGGSIAEAKKIKATAVGDMQASTQFKAKMTVIGELGQMQLDNPLAPQLGHRLGLEIQGKQTPETFTKRSSYEFQLDAFRDAVALNQQPLTGADDAVKQMRLIDNCYLAAGMRLRGL